MPSANRRVLTLLVVLMMPCICQAADVPEPVTPQPDMLVGAYYFPGWSDPSRWYCIKANEDVQHPLLGYYPEGDPLAADWHIKWALEHGVSFFAFDHYILQGSERLEAALADGLLKSRFIDKFRFCLNWCNHAPVETQTREEFEQFAELVVDKYLAHPSYLKIDDRPVVMILSGYSFVKNLGVEGARDAFSLLNRRCEQAGLPDAYLVFCEGNIMGEQAVKDSFAAGAEAFCLYNYPYAGTDQTGPGEYAEASYEHLVEQGLGLWKHWRGITDGRFWPTVMPGWDRRPWLRDRDLVRTGSTPELFKRSLSLAREHVNADRIVMIEAWNEWGEGSILEPSVEYGAAYLQQVRDVFCPSAPSPDVGLDAPIYELQLPRANRWAFDFDIEGWRSSGVEDLHFAHGSLVATSTSNDPQFNAPPNYVDPEARRRASVRMRVTPPEGAPETGVGQFFWSTVERALSEQSSVHFTVFLDGRWHEYSLDVASNPNWAGIIDGLRLDPVDIKGATIEVDRIQLLP